MAGARVRFQSNRRPTTKRWGMLGCGWDGVINIGDVDGVVGEERLEFREAQFQFARKKGMWDEQKVPTASPLLEEVISGQRQLKFKENQDANPITEVAVLGINGTNKIR